MDGGWTDSLSLLLGPSLPPSNPPNQDGFLGNKWRLHQSKDAGNSRPPFHRASLCCRGRTRTQRHHLPVLVTGVTNSAEGVLGGGLSEYRQV